MFHQIRWTAQKIAQRVQLVNSLVYRRRTTLPYFRFRQLAGPEEAPLTTPTVDDSHWPVIEPGTIWANPDTNFVLRTQFQLPANWDASLPIALYLPIGETGDFSHPEALVYIDGKPYAACDRHHQEILLADRYLTTRSSTGSDLVVNSDPVVNQVCPEHFHTITLHGWTGGTQTLRFDGRSDNKPRPQLIMNPCEIVQIDQPTRDFVVLARMALETAVDLDENNPTQAHLLNALDEAFKILDTREPLGELFYDSVPEAFAVLKAGVELAGDANTSPSILARTPNRLSSGCPTSLATPGICPNSSKKRGWNISSPSKLAGASTTACPTIPSGGKGWTAVKC